MPEQTFEDLNANEVLEKVEAGEIAPEEAIEIEQKGKNRKTLIDSLQKLAGKSESTSEIQSSEPETAKFVLLKNVKHNDKRYKVGEEIELTETEQEAFIKSGIIKE